MFDPDSSKSIKFHGFIWAILRIKLYPSMGLRLILIYSGTLDVQSISLITIEINFKETLSFG